MKNTITIYKELLEDGFLDEICNKYGFFRLKSKKYPIIDTFTYNVLENIKDNDYIWKNFSFETLPKEIIEEMSNENTLFDNVERMNDYLEI